MGSSRREIVTTTSAAAAAIAHLAAASSAARSAINASASSPIIGDQQFEQSAQDSLDVAVKNLLFGDTSILELTRLNGATDIGAT